jgi:hypothetical protein
MPNVRVTIGHVPVPSQHSDIVVVRAGESLTIWFDVHDYVDAEKVGVRFSSVRAYRWRDESHCGVEQVSELDAIVEVEESDWVRELREATPSDLRGTWTTSPKTIRHFMLVTHSDGCYEVAAAAWRLVDADDELRHERGVPVAP